MRAERGGIVKIIWTYLWLSAAHKVGGFRQKYLNSRIRRLADRIWKEMGEKPRTRRSLRSRTDAAVENESKNGGMEEKVMSLEVFEGSHGSLLMVKDQTV